MKNLKFTMDKNLKDTLISNGFGDLIKSLEKVKPSGANQMAGGIQFVYDNWDVSPNGGVLYDIIEYLKTKAKQHISKTVCLKQCGQTLPSGGADNICLSCGSSIEKI